MTQINNERELLQIGGPEKYKQYFNRITAFIKAAPTKDEATISRATNIPLIAVRRALREGAYEKATGVEKPEDPALLLQKAALLNSLANAKKAQSQPQEPKSQLVADLNARKKKK